MEMIWAHDRYRVTDTTIEDAGMPFLWWKKRSKLQLVQTRWECAVFEDEACTREILTLRRYMMPGYSAVWDVADTRTSALVGRLRLRSDLTNLQGKYEIVDGNDRHLGELVPIIATALLSAFLPFPDTSSLVVGAQVVASIKRSPLWTVHCDVVLSDGGQAALDPRLCVAAGLVLQQGRWSGKA